MSVSAIIVTYKQIELTLAALASLERQTVAVDQVIVVDNDPARSAAAPLRAVHPELVILEEDNIGYAPACNRAAAVATGDWLFFLNPDAEAAPDCLEQLLAAADRHPQSGIVTPQVLLPDGRINAGENEIHLTGIAWCGGYGHPPEDGPERPVFITTGAAMLVRRDLYEQLDGYCDEFFLFYEDPDLCWRAWLAGSEVWYVPRALVRHHYSWGLDNEKWFFLERHRLMSVLTNFRLSTLALLTPLLVATELALLVVSGREGWRDQKLRAYRSVWAQRKWIRARRRRFAKLRRRPDAAIIGGFRATVDSPQITSRVAGAAAPGLRLYAALVRGAVRMIGR
jgi:GT2 family glycosyltransferase